MRKISNLNLGNSPLSVHQYILSTFLSSQHKSNADVDLVGRWIDLPFNSVCSVEAEGLILPKFVFSKNFTSAIHYTSSPKHVSTSRTSKIASNDRANSKFLHSLFDKEVHLFKKAVFSKSFADWQPHESASGKMIVHKYNCLFEKRRSKVEILKLGGGVAVSSMISRVLYQLF